MKRYRQIDRSFSNRIFNHTREEEEKKKRLELGRLVVDEKSRQEDFMILA